MKKQKLIITLAVFGMLLGVAVGCQKKIMVVHQTHHHPNNRHLLCYLD